MEALVNTSIRQGILRANSLYLVVASILGLRMDIMGIFFGSGPEARVVGTVPFAGIATLRQRPVMQSSPA